MGKIKTRVIAFILAFCTIIQSQTVTTMAYVVGLPNEQRMHDMNAIWLDFFKQYTNGTYDNAEYIVLSYKANGPCINKDAIYHNNQKLYLNYENSIGERTVYGDENGWCHVSYFGSKPLFHYVPTGDGNSVLTIIATGGRLENPYGANVTPEQAKIQWDNSNYNPSLSYVMLYDNYGIDGSNGQIGMWSMINMLHSISNGGEYWWNANTGQTIQLTYFDKIYSDFIIRDMIKMNISGNELDSSNFKVHYRHIGPNKNGLGWIEDTVRTQPKYHELVTNNDYYPYNFFVNLKNDDSGIGGGNVATCSTYDIGCNIGKFFTQTMDNFSRVLNGWISGSVATINIFFDKLGSGIGKTFTDVGEFISNSITGTINNVSYWITNATTTVSNGINSVVSAINNNVFGTLEEVGNMLELLMSNLFTPTDKSLSLWNGVVDKFKTKVPVYSAIEGVENGLNTSIGGVSNTETFDLLGVTVQYDLYNMIVKPFESYKEKIHNVMNPVLVGFFVLGLFKRLSSAFGSAQSL